MLFCVAFPMMCEHVMCYLTTHLSHCAQMLAASTHHLVVINMTKGFVCHFTRAELTAYDFHTCLNNMLISFVEPGLKPGITMSCWAPCLWELVCLRHWTCHDLHSRFVSCSIEGKSYFASCTTGTDPHQQPPEIFRRLLSAELHFNPECCIKSSQGLIKVLSAAFCWRQVAADQISTQLCKPAKTGTALSKVETQAKWQFIQSVVLLLLLYWNPAATDQMTRQHFKAVRTGTATNKDS